tara:strand:+ start:549 stop:1031 length:483 start_codon:yes stop_codon:yes gene_type:complete
MKVKWDGKCVVGSMWERKSPLWQTHQDLWDELVPDSGMAQTTAGEAVRCIARLYYDAYNNGGCNSYHEGENEFLAFLVQWSHNHLVIRGPCIVGDVSLITKAFETMRKSIKHAWRLENVDDEYRNDHEGWEALDDKPYLEALELLAHWVAWTVANEREES